MNDPIRTLGDAMTSTNCTPAGLDKTRRVNDDGTVSKHQWNPHEGKSARERRLRQMARRELKMLKQKHGTDVLLNGRTPQGIIVEPVRAKRFDDGVVDLQEHESR